MLVVLNGSRWYMSKDYMVIIVKAPNQKASIIKIPKRLNDMSKLIGGTIEIKQHEDVLLVYNENQKDSNLQENKLFDNLNLKGTILIIGNEERFGDIMSLRKKQILKYIKKLNDSKSKDKEI